MAESWVGTVRLGCVLGAASVLVLASAACSGPEPVHETGTPSPPIQVSTVEAVWVETAERLDAGGVVAADATAVVSSRIVAAVRDVRVRAGDRVRAGQVLVVLDDRDLSPRLNEARAGVRVAQQASSGATAERDAATAEARLARAWHERITRLHERTSATAQERDEADARLAGAEARVASAEARIAEAAARLEAAEAAVESATAVMSFATIHAPFDGLVTERMVDAGALASPGMPLLTLDAGGRRKVRVHVDEARVSYVRMGDRVPVLFDADRGRPADARSVNGQVTEIARTVQADRRTFTVDVSLPPDVTARTGTFARVQFSGPPRRALVLPESAVRRTGQIASVFVVEGETARLRLVQTGSSIAEGVEVLSGLDAGERVVRDPPAPLVDGRRVTPGPPPPSGEGR